MASEEAGPANSRPSLMYIKDLPAIVHAEVCSLIDRASDTMWKKVAEIMKFTFDDIKRIEEKSCRERSSPATNVINEWGYQLHYVKELFVVMYRCEMVRALRLLVPYVDTKFNRLLEKLENKFSLDEYPNRNAEVIPVPVRQIGQGCPGIGVAGENDRLHPEEATTSQNVTIGSNSTTGHSGVIKDFSPIIPLGELMKATNNFDPANLLDSGGYGKVYRGVWKETDVAVKMLFNVRKPSVAINAVREDFFRELCLNRYRHENIVQLYGYTMDPCILVYPLMAQGSLKDKLDSKPPLTWPQRLRIAVGTARGIQFLHRLTTPPLIHGDIKPANILLDQYLEPKIADFGLARCGPNMDDQKDLLVSKVQGTAGYTPADYIYTKKLSPGVDVFSFGLVLMQIATALKVQDNSRQKRLKLLHMYIRDEYNRYNSLQLLSGSVEDPAIRGTALSNVQLCSIFLKIGIECTKFDVSTRPDMVTVYRELNQINVDHIPNGSNGAD